VFSFSRKPLNEANHALLEPEQLRLSRSLDRATLPPDIGQEQAPITRA